MERSVQIEACVSVYSSRQRFSVELSVRIEGQEGQEGVLESAYNSLQEG